MKPDLAEQARIARNLAEFHDEMSLITTGEDRADHIHAAEVCRKRAIDWEQRRGAR